MPGPIPNRRYAIWLSDPSTASVEIARQIGYGAVVIDIEHGVFDIADLERFVPFIKSLGLEVLAKVLGPERGPIQQALDFGADAVVIPHIENLEHARAVTAFAKFPPLGDRSLAGGRTSAYGGFTDEWVAAQDLTTKCYPMIEDAGALEDIEPIIALPTVDGVFIGPSDLAIRRNRGAYSREAGDFADMQRIADAANEAGKPWILPAWSLEEKSFALSNNVGQMALTMQNGALLSGFAASLEETKSVEKALSK